MEKIINAVCDEFTQTTVTKNAVKRKKFVDRLIAELGVPAPPEPLLEDAMNTLNSIANDPNIKLKDARKMAAEVLALEVDQESTSESGEGEEGSGEEDDPSEDG